MSELMRNDLVALHLHWRFGSRTSVLACHFFPVHRFFFVTVRKTVLSIVATSGVSVAIDVILRVETSVQYSMLPFNFFYFFCKRVVTLAVGVADGVGFAVGGSAGVVVDDSFRETWGITRIVLKQFSHIETVFFFIMVCDFVITLIKEISQINYGFIRLNSPNRFI